jgi:hypothetical protein
VPPLEQKLQGKYLALSLLSYVKGGLAYDISKIQGFLTERCYSQQDMATMWEDLNCQPLPHRYHTDFPEVAQEIRLGLAEPLKTLLEILKPNFLRLGVQVKEEEVG